MEEACRYGLNAVYVSDLYCLCRVWWSRRNRHIGKNDEADAPYSTGACGIYLSRRTGGTTQRSRGAPGMKPATALPPEPDGTPFEKFDRLIRKVIAVPKQVIDREEKRWQQQKQKNAPISPRDRSPFNVITH